MYHIFFYRCVGQRKGDDSYSIGSDIVFVIQERSFFLFEQEIVGDVRIGRMLDACNLKSFQ